MTFRLQNTNDIFHKKKWKISQKVDESVFFWDGDKKKIINHLEHDVQNSRRKRILLENVWTVLGDFLP